MFSLVILLFCFVGICLSLLRFACERFLCYIYIYIYTFSVAIYIYIYKSKHTRQRLAVATQSFTPVDDLQATDISNLLHAHINKADYL